MANETSQAFRRQLDPGVLLQIGTTFAALAVALAALGQDEGPNLGEVAILPALLLMVGLVTVFGSLWAMAAIWDNAGL